MIRKLWLTLFHLRIFSRNGPVAPRGTVKIATPTVIGAFQNHWHMLTILATITIRRHSLIKFLDKVFIITKNSCPNLYFVIFRYAVSYYKSLCERHWNSAMCSDNKTELYPHQTVEFQFCDNENASVSNITFSFVVW